MDKYDCLRKGIVGALVDAHTAKIDVSITPQPDGGPPQVKARGEGSFLLKNGTTYGDEFIDLTVTPRLTQGGYYMDNIAAKAEIDAKEEGRASASASFSSLTVNPPNGDLSQNASTDAFRAYYRTRTALAVCGPWPKAKTPKP